MKITNVFFFNNIHGLDSEYIEKLPSKRFKLIISHDENKISDFFIPEIVTIVGRAQYDLSTTLRKFVWTQFTFPKVEDYERTHAWF